MIKFSLSVIFFLTLLNVHAESMFYNSFSVNVGMINHSVTETESNLTKTDNVETTTTDETKEAAKAVSAISLNGSYEFLPTQNRTFFVAGSAPLMSTGGTGIYAFGGGVNWYLSELSTKYSYESRGSTIVITPEFKYYWGLNSGVGYLVYTTESSKKSDLFFDIGLHGGGGYALSQKRSLKFEAGVGRTTGVATNGFKINVFFGVIQYL